jgi:hypothetical protein
VQGNRYSDVGGDPVNAVDPNGTDQCYSTSMGGCCPACKDGNRYYNPSPPLKQSLLGCVDSLGADSFKGSLFATLKGITYRTAIRGGAAGAGVGCAYGFFTESG